MLKSEELIKEALSINTLEKEYKRIKKEMKNNDASKLSIKDVRTLLAYEYLDDGAEKDFVEEIWRGHDKAYDNKADLLRQLKVFGYK